MWSYVHRLLCVRAAQTRSAPVHMCGCTCAEGRQERHRTDTQGTHALPTNAPLPPSNAKTKKAGFQPGEVDWDAIVLLLHVETAKGPVNEGADSGALWCLQHNIKHTAW